MSWSAFRTFTDPDAYQAAFRDMRTASVITGRGDFRADFVTIQLERLSLQDAKETLPRTAYCAVDPRLFGIGFATHPRQEIHVNSLELVPGAIAVFREASEGHNRFGSASRWGSVALPHEDYCGCRADLNRTRVGGAAAHASYQTVAASSVEAVEPAPGSQPPRPGGSRGARRCRSSASARAGADPGNDPVLERRPGDRGWPCLLAALDCHAAIGKFSRGEPRPYFAFDGPLRSSRGLGPHTSHPLPGASRDESDTLPLAAAHASGPSSAEDGRSDDNHCDRDSDELCFLRIGPLRGGLSLALWRDTLGNAAAPARRPPAAKNFGFALAAS